MSLYVGGNYVFAMAPLVAAFEQRYPEYRGRLYWETIPPGLLVRQMKAGGTITVGNMTWMVKPDIYLAGKDAVERQVADGLLIGPVVPYVTNTLAIMVAKDNPAKVTGLASLGDPRIAVVDGAGQQGMWEDIAGRRGDIATVKAFRRNVVLFAKNTGLALKGWKADPTIDAWLTFPIWAKANPDVADVVALDADRLVYRDAGVALTTRGQERAGAKAFVRFLSGPQGTAIFRKWGWQ